MAEYIIDGRRVKVCSLIGLCQSDPFVAVFSGANRFHGKMVSLQ
ncbi:hypothetical protein [Desulfosarcina ovata]|nr:hypothetical protein [Desulfosarcina ovata]